MRLKKAVGLLSAKEVFLAQLHFSICTVYLALHDELSKRSVDRGRYH
jgi:hypothetical protein